MSSLGAVGLFTVNFLSNSFSYVFQVFYLYTHLIKYMWQHVNIICKV
jgi:hypothetical protein